MTRSNPIDMKKPIECVVRALEAWTDTLTMRTNMTQKSNFEYRSCRTGPEVKGVKENYAVAF